METVSLFQKKDCSTTVSAQVLVFSVCKTSCCRVQLGQNGSYSLFDTKHHAWNRLCHNPWLLSSGTSLAFRCLQWRLFYFRVSCILFVLVVKYFLYIKNAFWCSLLPQHVCKKRSSLIL